jgi:hypothetical protein
MKLLVNHTKNILRNFSEIAPDDVFQFQLLSNDSVKLDTEHIHPLMKSNIDMALSFKVYELKKNGAKVMDMLLPTIGLPISEAVPFYQKVMDDYNKVMKGERVD